MTAHWQALLFGGISAALSLVVGLSLRAGLQAGRLQYAQVLGRRLYVDRSRPTAFRMTVAMYLFGLTACVAGVVEAIADLLT